MYGSSPFYRSYNPYLHSSYYQPQPQYNPFGPPPYQNQRPVDLERARSLAAQRARRAQWLPDEYDDDDDYYDAHQLSPRERAYLNAHKNRELIERERQRREQEEAGEKRRALEERKWQQELDRRQKEDESARRRVEEERERRRQQQQAQSSQRRSPSPTHTVPITTPNERPVSQQAPRQPTPPPQYDEKHAEAASVLQRYFRMNQSIRTIKSLGAEFDTLRREFTYPSIISFQDPSPTSTSTDAINIPAVSPSSIIASTENDIDSSTQIPKLAFNSTNYTLHAYNEALDKLLVKLDGVQSWGDSDVRSRRRQVVKQIEEEQAFIDNFWRTSWLKHIEEQGEWVDGDLLAEPRL